MVNKPRAGEGSFDLHLENLALLAAEESPRVVAHHTEGDNADPEAGTSGADPSRKRAVGNRQASGELEDNEVGTSSGQPPKKKAKAAQTISGT